MDYQAEDIHAVRNNKALYVPIYHSGHISEAISYYYCEEVTHVSYEAMTYGPPSEHQSSIQEEHPLLMESSCFVLSRSYKIYSLHIYRHFSILHHSIKHIHITLRLNHVF